MHRRHDIAEQLELAHLAVVVLVGATLDRTREGPAQGATLLTVDRHLGRELVLGDGADKGDGVEIRLRELGELFRSGREAVIGDGREIALAKLDPGRGRAALHAPGVAGICDQHDAHTLGVGQLHPLEQLVVDDALARGGSTRLIAAQ